MRNVREALNKSSARREQQTEADIGAIFFFTMDTQAVAQSYEC